MKMTKHVLKIMICVLFCFSFIQKTVGQNTYSAVWQIGEADGSAKEFGIYESDFRKYASSFGSGVILHEVGKNKSGDIPYFLPGPSDSWSGVNRSEMIIRFALDGVESSTSSKLRINLVEVHPASPPQLNLTINDYQTTVRTPKGSNPSYFDNKQTSSKGLFVEIDIPAGKLNTGDNTIVIRNGAGSWLVFDNIALSASKALTVGKASGTVSLLNSEAVPALVYAKDNTLHQPVKLNLANWNNKPQTVDVHVDNKLLKKITLAKGINEVELTVPESTEDKEISVKLLMGNKTIAESKLNIKPIKKWTVYLVQHTHTDIGYTKPQTEILTEHLRYIDYAIEYSEMTENYPDDAKFRWTCEASWAVREYLQCRPKEQIEKLIKYINKGQIEVTAMFFNMAEIVDENSFKTFLEPLREFKKHNIPVKTAMQNDVNGVAWCLADYLPDLGVKYVSIGEHGHRALIPFDKPTVFKWESPSGKPIYAYRADHYNTGNGWGIENGNMNAMAPKMLAYLTNLEKKNYPFDAVAAQYSGYFTDNSPPSMIENKLIEEWNKKYAYPKLRSALVSEFLDYVIDNHESELETHRVAYPDWWTDGFGSAARETGASRKTHSDMITVEGMLSMASLMNKELPANTKDNIRHIHESLLFYDEHTFGAAESIGDPMSENSQVQWAEKSAFVWEGLKSAQMLYETSIGLLQNDLKRGKNPTITFFNTLNWQRSDMMTVYIDFEVLPQDTPFKIVDEKGNALKTQAIRSRREGTYYAIYAENIPAMGYKTYEIAIDNKQSNSLPAIADASKIENEFYAITIDKEKGAISSIIDKQLNTEMVDQQSPWQLGAFVYETLDNRNQMEGYHMTDYKREGIKNARITGAINGAIYQRIMIEGKSDGCDKDFGVKMEIKLFHHTKRIELAYAIKRLPITDPTGIYVAFPFKLNDAKLSFDVQGGLLNSGENQLTGTSTAWNTVQNFVTARNQQAQFVVGSDIIPLFQLGEIVTGKFQYKKEYDKPHAFSWVMNNYWTTNFRALQEGEFKWSYYLTSSDDISNVKATKFGWSSRVPLYARVMPVGKENNKPAEYSAFNIENDNLLMTSCTPSADKGYVLLNIRELDGKAAKLSILDNRGNPISFSVVNAVEEVLTNDKNGAEFIPFENKFIKLKL